MLNLTASGCENLRYLLEPFFGRVTAERAYSSDQVQPCDLAPSTAPTRRLQPPC